MALGRTDRLEIVGALRAYRVTAHARVQSSADVPPNHQSVACLAHAEAVDGHSGCRQFWRLSPPLR
jgi:hypothetical protein